MSISSKTITLNNLIIIIFIVLVMSCKKDDKEAEINPIPNTPESGNFNIKVEHVFDTSNFVLNDLYILDNGNKIAVSTYKYYISNLKLRAEDGSVFSENESYHLINAEQAATCNFTISKVPLKKYTSISFIIGVDSARNVSGAQSGALDPALGMFWTWNTGYIMAKLEGISQQSSAPGNSVAFHIGGFKGNYNSLKQITVLFNGNLATVTSASTPTLIIKNNIKEWFINPISLDLSITNNIREIIGNKSNGCIFVSPGIFLEKHGVISILHSFAKAKSIIIFKKVINIFTFNT